eukprot:9503759-Pyramimonas_sp.AAC.4
MASACSAHRGAPRILVAGAEHLARARIEVAPLSPKPQRIKIRPPRRTGPAARSRGNRPFLTQ